MPTISKPYTFSAGSVIYSAQVNADFDALYAAINGNLDNANIGPLGFYASQIIPLTSGQATFGGTQIYTFPSGLSVPTSKSISGDVLNKVFNVRTYGAKGDGTTDDTVAINAAVSACHAATYGAAGAGCVYFPAGLYRITGSIDLTGMGGAGSGDTLHGMAFLGSGQGSSIIYADAGSYDIFKGGAYGPAANTLVNFSWKNLKFLCNGTNMTGGAVWRLPSATNIWISDCDLQAHFHLLDVGDAVSNSGNVVTLFMRDINAYNQYGDFIRTHTRSQQFFVNDCMVTGANASYVAGSNWVMNLVSSGSLTPGFDLIDMQDCDFESMGGGFNWNAAKGDLSDSYFGDLFFDGTTNQSLIVAPGTGGSGFKNIVFQGCVFWAGNGNSGGGIDAALLQPSGSGVLQGFIFNACQFFTTVEYAVQIGSVQGVQFNECRMNQSTIGVYFNGGGSPVAVFIRGCAIGNDRPGQQNGKGVVIDSPTINTIIIEGNYIGGNTTSQLTDNSTSRTNCSFRNNVGYNPVGAPANPSQPAVAATTVAVANPYAQDCIVYVLNNGASNLTFSVSGANGNTTNVPIPANATVPVLVPIGSAIKLNYTAGTPAWTWMLN